MSKSGFDPFGATPASGPRMELDPGRGNLNLQALIAAVVGPARIAHGAKRLVRLEPNEPTRIANLSPASGHCSYVALYLAEFQQGPLIITLGAEDADSAIPVQIESRVGGHGGFSAVLLPGDSLYAQSKHKSNVSLTVAEVHF